MTAKLTYQNIKTTLRQKNILQDVRTLSTF